MPSLPDNYGGGNKVEIRSHFVKIFFFLLWIVWYILSGKSLREIDNKFEVCDICLLDFSDSWVVADGTAGIWKNRFGHIFIWNIFSSSYLPLKNFNGFKVSNVMFTEKKLANLPEV